MIVPAASSMKGDALTASSFFSSQCSPEASQYLPNCFVAERRAIWWSWRLIAFTFVSKTKSNFFQRSRLPARMTERGTSFSGQRRLQRKRLLLHIYYLYRYRSGDLYVREWSLLREGATNSREALKFLNPDLERAKMFCTHSLPCTGGWCRLVVLLHTKNVDGVPRHK